MITPRIPRSALLVAATALVALPFARAGLMDASIPLQDYRDFAENRGIFAPDATNVAIYNTDGVLVGTIPRMANFDGVSDAHVGEAALVGGQSFISTVSHDYWASTITFTQRFGATSGTPFYDSYKLVSVDNGGDATQDSTYDYRVQRLDKIVTEATANAYLTDPAILNNMIGRQVLRVGSGAQVITNGTTETTVAGAYTYLTGGTVNFTRETIALPPGSTLPPQPWPAGVTYVVKGASSAPASAYNAYNFFLTFGAPTASSPMPSITESGDSGSPAYIYNENTGAWEWLAAGRGGSKSNYSAESESVSGNQWAVSVINGYDSPVVTPTAGAGTILWNAPAADGSGTLTQGATSWNYIGLAPGLRGSTSTTGTAATNAELNATRNLIFAGDGGVIQLGGSLDMGAGSLTFAADYTLTDGGVNTRRLNTAGYILKNGVTVTSSLTGSTGDEWRVFGDGKFVITGSGANAADLNVGGSLLTELNRTGGAAVRNVKINGGAATVRLIGDNQISGEVIFGHRGGTLDLRGHDFSDAAITHLDSGANIANLKANSTSTFTFTGSGTQNYLGDFSDGGSLANGLLNVNYNPGTPAGAVWNLSGVVINKGAFTVSAGEVRVAGVPTLHANNYVDPNDWQTAVFDTGTVSVANGATFTAGAHANVASSISVAGGGTFNLLTGSNHTGNVALTASNAMMVADITSGAIVESGAITGTGGLTKIGAGALYLTNAGNTFSGASTINQGVVIGSSAAALGGSANWTVTPTGVIAATGATAAQVKAKVTTSSTGTLALAGTNPDAAPNLTGYANLFLGAIGAQTVGTSGTSSQLTKWAGGNTGWNLGGGGGDLTMNLKLSGAGTLTLGNGRNLGTVTLTNTKNNSTTGGARFTGAIVVNSGVSLLYTNINALGQIGTTDRITVNYGGLLALGTGTNATTVFNTITGASAGVLAVTGTDTNAYNFSAQGMNSAALGANGTATYSGTLTAGTNGYKFGGDGNLAVTSALSGANALSIDGQGSSAGVTTLSGNNTFTGAITVQGGVYNGILGSHTLAVGSNGALGAGASLTVNDGGIVDLNGKSASAGTLSGTAQSVLTNSAAGAGTLTIGQSADATFAGTLSGALNLVKNGAGTLTLSGANTQSGALSINAGTLRLGSDTALGYAGNTVAVASGAALDLNGFKVSDNVAVSLTGTGIGSAGALMNGSTVKAYLKNVTLSGNTTVANTSVQGDIVIGSITAQDGTLNLAGYTLTKNGTGTLTLTGVNLTGAGNIVVNAGTLQLVDDYVAGNSALQQNTTIAGTGTITVNSGAALLTQHWYNTLNVSMGIVLNGGTFGSTYPGPNGATIGSNISLTANSTLNFNGGGYGNVTLSGIISGDYGLTVTGDSTTRTLTGANTYTGNTTLTGGTLKIGGAGLLGGGDYAGALSMATGTTFNYASTANQTLSGVISGAGALTKSTAASTLTLTGANTYTGVTTISAGTLQIGNGGTSGSLGSGAVVNNATLAVNRSDAITLANAISGIGALTQNGTGTTTLSGNNTYTGGTTVNSGTLVAANAGALGSGALAVNGGTLDLNAGAVNTGAVSLNGGVIQNGTLTGSSYATNSGTISAVLAGTGALTQSGGTTTLSGNNAYTGVTTVDSGALNINGTLRNTAAITVNDGATATFGVTNLLVANHGTAVADTRVITVNGGTLIFGNNESRIGNVTLSNGGTLTSNRGLAAWDMILANTTSGAATVAVTGTGMATMNGPGGIHLQGVQNFDIADTVAGSGTDLQVSMILASQGSVGGAAGGVRKLGLGTMVLSGTNTYTGGTTVDAGTLVAANTGALGSGALTVNSGALDLNAGAVNTGAVALNGGTIQNGTLTGASCATNSGTISANLAGSGALTQSGGTTTLSGNNTYTGGTTINSGTLVAANTGALGSGALAVNSGALDLNAGAVNTGAVSLNGGAIQNGTLTGASYATNSGTISANLAGTGALTQSGGTTTLTGNNTYTGGTFVSAGTLQIGDGVANGTFGGAYSVASGASLRLYRNTASTLDWNSLTGAGTLSLNSAQATGANWGNTGTNAFNAGFTGTLKFEKGRLEVLNPSTQLGGMTAIEVLDGGQISFYQGGTISQNFRLAGTGWGESGYELAMRLGNSTTTTLNGTITLTGNATIGTGRTSAGVATFNGVIDGGFGLSFGSSSTATGTYLLKAANTYTGDTSVKFGTLNLANTNALQNSTLNHIAGTVVFDSSVASNAFTLGGLSGSTGIALRNNAVTPAAIALSVGNNNASTNYSGTLSADGSLIKIGTGTTTLSGNNTYTGGTAVNAGTLVAGSNSAFGTGAVTVGGTGVLNSGTGRTLANAFTVNNGGALGGAATFTGAVSINSGATLTPGSAGAIGRQTFNNGVTLAAGASYLWEIMGNTPSVAGTDFDQIAVTGGNLNIASGAVLKIAALAVDYTGSFWDSSQTFTLATKSGTGTITGAFALDTTGAGAFSGEGSWSLLTDGAGDLQALWTAGSGMQGMQGMSIQAVPEPSTYGLLGAGALAAVALVRRRKRKTV